MADAGIAQINQLNKDDIVIALMGITGSGYVQTTNSSSTYRVLLISLSL
jgi:hypothetical protein